MSSYKGSNWELFLLVEKLLPQIKIPFSLMVEVRGCEELKTILNSDILALKTVKEKANDTVKSRWLHKHLDPYLVELQERACSVLMLRLAYALPFTCFLFMHYFMDIFVPVSC